MIPKTGPPLWLYRGDTFKQMFKVCQETIKLTDTILFSVRDCATGRVMIVARGTELEGDSIYITIPSAHTKYWPPGTYLYDLVRCNEKGNTTLAPPGILQVLDIAHDVRFLPDEPMIIKGGVKNG